MDFLKNQALSLVLPFVLGPAAFHITQAAKRGSNFIDNQGAAVKVGVAFAVSALFVAAASFAGVDAPACVADKACQLNDFTEPFVKAVLGAGVAVLMHKQKKANPDA